jgi:hypothetical protein
MATSFVAIVALPASAMARLPDQPCSPTIGARAEGPGYDTRLDNFDVDQWDPVSSFANARKIRTNYPCNNDGNVGRDFCERRFAYRVDDYNGATSTDKARDRMRPQYGGKVHPRGNTFTYKIKVSRAVMCVQPSTNTNTGYQPISAGYEFDNTDRPTIDIDGTGYLANGFTSRVTPEQFKADRSNVYVTNESDRTRTITSPSSSGARY